jgi:glycogen phosphorylase
MNRGLAPRALPTALNALKDLALDLRWTWSHAADDLWRAIDAVSWERSENPWTILQDISDERLAAVAADAHLAGELRRLDEARRAYLADPGWYGRTHATAPLARVAYFCMEFGLAEALPLYAGGLGILAGDFLKAASDLGVPLVGVGLLYNEGYFRQMLDAQGRQHEVFPYNDPISLPVRPVEAERGGWLHVSLDFPGRTLFLRVWQAQVGRVTLYLLDSNDPLNSPVDRGITGKLYGGGEDMRLLQEMVLGVGGWRALEAVGLQIDVCHLNEGHAALAIIERARSFMLRVGTTFWESLWATRAGNVFTTHTPVPAGFDRFPPALIQQFLPYFRGYVAQLGIPLADLLALGREDPRDDTAPFNMAYLAIRGSIATNAVSRLHGEVSRGLFRGLFPRWPEHEVPVSHVTNGIHVPSWESPQADRTWSAAAGEERWLGELESVAEGITSVSDEALWACRSAERRVLVDFARRRLARQLGYRGADPEVISRAGRVLDANALTIGFARRFTPYKRPDLLLRDPDRLTRLLTDPQRPVQLLVAGKAHPADTAGKALVQRWVAFAERDSVRDHVVFLEDYDITLAEELVRGVDVWVNTPRRPMEACGTSGMKVLANGGLNLSVLDGWWDEAYDPDVGWPIGDRVAHTDESRDAADAERLYATLEGEIVPAFYERDARGVPISWVARVRASLSCLTPRFSANRMVREYVASLYLPAGEMVRRRTLDRGRLGAELHAWADALAQGWSTLRFGSVDARPEGNGWTFAVQLFLGSVDPDAIAVELYAEARDGEPAVGVPMAPAGPVADVPGGVWYRASVVTVRPAEEFTPRVVPYHPEARVPTEALRILWQR